MHVLKIVTNFTGKHLCWSLFFKKFAALRPATLSKRRLQHLEKFLRKPFLKNTQGSCFCKVTEISILLVLWKFIGAISTIYMQCSVKSRLLKSAAENQHCSCALKVYWSYKCNLYAVFFKITSSSPCYNGEKYEYLEEFTLTYWTTLVIIHFITIFLSHVPPKAVPRKYSLFKIL